MSTAQIDLGRGRFALVDADHVEWLSQWSWRWGHGGIRSEGYAKHTTYRDGKRTTLLMHRLIAEAPAGFEVDHKNRNSLDNRRDNLRVCTRAENMRNRSYTSQRGGYRGAHPKRHKWIALITTDGRQESLGIFAEEMGAAIAYDEAAKRLHGEFAFLNFSADRDWILICAPSARKNKSTAVEDWAAERLTEIGRDGK